ncbi:hypothetical protein A2V49_03375 [candidate division WWE3 bacterium RBG_19FT_COMBO_34_6]|uniref:Uncharacterized protein n=1 Tax=candidate division WWE3 bacterium RBG_19FT_COMBO_34_6 TaxID=1802612 RepID=A0A1F4UKF8_UNCKA|nr:MAG: hypothetical protein A2V49_03375 [candidate division WWE3 bacterium RBG_19FT_COMBO_34_6]
MKIIIVKNLISYFFGVIISIFAIILFFNITGVKTVLGNYVNDWGVLAINTNKDIYYPNENIHIEYGVLDHNGIMECSAYLELIVYDSKNNIIKTLSTLDNSIKTSPTCRQKESKVPDFESNFSLENNGQYRLVLNAVTKNGSYSKEKTIKVDDKKVLDVEKISSTRIYPKDKYEVKIKVSPQKNFSGKVEEVIPSVFEISESSLFDIKKIDNFTNKIIWEVKWEKGKNYELVYEYKAPEVSPDYFETGPTSFISNFLPDKFLLSNNIYTLSPWQIAVDALITRYSTSCSGAWTNPANAQGSPTLASNAAYSSFTTSNSASARVSDANSFTCTTLNGYDLGQFISANIVFSFATDGTAAGDDLVRVDYDPNGTTYTLTSITQNSQKSNATNGGYWSFSAGNITSFDNITNLTISFNGVKSGGPDRRTAYVDAVWVDITYNARTYTQNDFEWFVTTGSTALTNIWPSGGGEDLLENQVLTQIPATNEPVDTNGHNQIRIQMNFTIGSYDLPASGNNYKLQYVAANDCTTASGWADIGAKGSATIWRLFDESALADSVAQVNDISTSNTGAEGYYSEINATGNNPNAITATNNTEWDWPIENNGATENTTYCFRMILTDSTLSFSYNADSYPKLTTAPGMSNLLKHGKIFQNDEEKGYFWAN